MKKGGFQKRQFLDAKPGRSQQDSSRKLLLLTKTSTARDSQPHRNDHSRHFEAFLRLRCGQENAPCASTKALHCQDILLTRGFIYLAFLGNPNKFKRKSAEFENLAR